MRLPWISIDADGQTRGRLLGRLLGVHELQGVGMAIALWHSAVEFSRDGDFSGDMPSAEFIAAACGWPVEDAKRLLAALQQVGLIATHPNLRVRGLDRYRRTWEKNQNFHRISAKSRPHVPSTGAKPANDGAKDEDEDEDEVNDVPAPVRIWPRKTEQQPSEPPKPKRERKATAAEDFFGWLGATRAAKGLPAEKKPPNARINAQFGEAIVQCGRPELERRYLGFLDDPTNAGKDPPWPWEVFAATWSWRKPKASQPQTESLAL